MKYLILVAFAAVALTGVQCDDYKSKDGIDLGELISLAVSKAIALALGSLKSGAQLEPGVLEDGISGIILKELDLDTDKAVYKQGGKYSEDDNDDDDGYDGDDGHDGHGNGGVYRRGILNGHEVEVEGTDPKVIVNRRGILNGDEVEVEGTDTKVVVNRRGILNGNEVEVDDIDSVMAVLPRGRRNVLLTLKKKLLGPAKKLLTLG